MSLKKIIPNSDTNKLFSFAFYSEICWFYFFKHFNVTRVKTIGNWSQFMKQEIALRLTNEHAVIKILCLTGIKVKETLGNEVKGKEEERL